MFKTSFSMFLTVLLFDPALRPHRPTVLRLSEQYEKRDFVHAKNLGEGQVFDHTMYSRAIRLPLATIRYG